MSAPLAEVVRRLGDQVLRSDAALLDLSSVEHDSRDVTPGALFACVPGANADGHDFAEQAVSAGAVAVLVERSIPCAVPQIEVESVRRAIGPASAEVYGNPSRGLRVVGVTGTNGKTTTVHLVGALVRALGSSAEEIGTLTGTRTTPEAPELQRILADARRRGVGVVAIEVSSHALDLHRVDGVEFAVVGFTNLGIDHLDHHGTIDAYLAAKQRLFSPTFSSHGVIVTDGIHGEELAASVERDGFAVTSIPADLVDSVAPGATASSFTWRKHGVVLPLGGEFNISNAVLAAELVHALGYETSDIAEALSLVAPVPGRFETVGEGQPFSVIVDYAHTPDGLEAVLNAARAVTERALVVVFGAGGDRDREKRPQMGDVARRMADRVVVTSDNPRGEDPQAIISGIVSGMHRNPDLIEPDRREAIRHAFAGAREGDVVVIAGKGHETTQTMGNDVLDFDDREVAREELRRLGGKAS